MCFVLIIIYSGHGWLGANEPVAYLPVWLLAWSVVICSRYLRLSSYVTNVTGIWRTTQSCRSIELSVYTGNYQHVKTFHIWSNLSVKYLEKIVDCYPQSDASDGIEQLASLFLVLYSILCPQWSASSKPWRATDDAAETTDDFLHFFFLIKNTV